MRVGDIKGGQRVAGERLGDLEGAPVVPLLFDLTLPVGYIAVAGTIAMDSEGSLLCTQDSDRRKPELKAVCVF